jgi:hypothetical protein
VNQQEKDHGLSTADVAAAGERANGDGQIIEQGDVESGVGTENLVPSPKGAEDNWTTNEARALDETGRQTNGRGDRFGRASTANGKGVSVASDVNGVSAATDQTPLLHEGDAAQFRSRWDEIQRGFVDEPQEAVEQADSLVAEAVQQVARVFAEERSNLEGQWSRGGEVSTDDLRLALQRYRSFFQRLLEV